MKTIAYAAAFAVLLSVPALAEKKFSEPEIVGFLEEVNQGEITAAQTAVEKSSDEEVLSFARRMIVDHGDARRKLAETGIQAAPCPDAKKLKEKHKFLSRKLDAAKKGAFDKAYLNAMVDGHAAVLEKIDKDLVPGAVSAPLTDYLRDFRPAVEAHLEHARRLKAGLEK